MQKKSLIVSWCITGVMFLALICNLTAGKGKENAAAEALERIEPFTKDYYAFSDLEDMRIEENNGKLAIYVSYVPDVGSFPVKLDIYERAAYYALQITKFYPEADFFQYNVLWNCYDSQTETVDMKRAMTLTIDESAVKELQSKYYSEYANEKAGFTPAYEDIFSSIEETEESKTWHLGTEKDA